MTTGGADRRAIITEALNKIDDLSARLEIAEHGETEPIAVVGIGCRLPGEVNTPDQFWQFLQDGRSGVVRVPPERWDADAFYSADRTVPGTICTTDGGFITSWKPDQFDAEHFSIAPREAEAMDPQQRLLLEVACEALEDAGITGQQIRGSQTSIFVGLTTNDYSLNLAYQLGRESVNAYASFGNAANFAAGRLSYFLGARGPALVIDTACSSSLVSVHLAAQSLRRRESDTALAAGVNLILRPENSIACSQFGMLSPDGRCRTFDAGANGYVRSEGCGVVVLKRLGDAQRDGDRVLAVVRGSAVNQDGASSGQTVPNGPAQQELLRRALAACRLRPCDIDYIEAHGTGTALGDPIELDALTRVFADRADSAPLVLGSVKTNLGHLESAAGITGFIKTVLSVAHGRIPKHLHFEQLTPHACEGASRFTIASEAMAWPRSAGPRRAGVSSFGVSGTNAHVVVEQGPDVVVGEPVSGSGGVSTLVVSGKSEARVASWAGVLADWLEGVGGEVGLAEVAHSVNHHRSRFVKFASVCARDRVGAVAGLRALASGRSGPGVVGPHRGVCGAGTVFVYSGQGSQWVGMGRRLLVDEPVFAAAVAELEPVFVAEAGFSLQSVLAGGESLVGIDRIQPVLVGVQLALTQLWRSYGVHPDAVIGHSMGEVAAAVVSGALSVAQGLRVIVTRSRLMARLSGRGAMALLELDAAGVEAVIADYPQVGVAVYASPRQTVVAGPPDEVDAVVAVVDGRGLLARRIEVDVASHHRTVDPILGELRAGLAGLVGGVPSIRLISTTGGGGAVFDAEYWVANLRDPVCFTQAVAAAAEDYATFIEISPHPLLTHAITDTLADKHHHSIGTLHRDTDDTVAFHTALNATHTVRPPDTPHPSEPHPRVPLTPWQHTRHWIGGAEPTRSDSAPRPDTVLGRHIEVAASGSPSAHLWQARLTPEARPYPGRHRIGGVEVVPASVVLRTFSTAAADIGVPAALSDICLEHPIVVDRPRLVQVTADDQSLTLSSSPDADTSARRWTRHATARFAAPPDAAGPRPEGSGSGATPEPFDPASIAELQRSWGIDGQPYAWTVTTCLPVPGGLCAEVDLPRASAAALVDAAVHLGRLADIGDPRLMFPAAVDGIRFAADVADTHGLVRVDRRDGGAGNDLVVDITVETLDGTTCLEIRSLRFAGLDSVPAAGDDGAVSLAHAVEWQPREEYTATERSDSQGTLAVVGRSDTARLLCDRLTGAGYDEAGVDDARHVLYLAGAGADQPGEPDIDWAARMVDEVADLVRRLSDRPDDHPVRLWIITTGVREAVDPDALAQSCLWGLAGVVGAEQPQLWGGLVDLPAGADIGEIAPTLASMLPHPARSVVAVRDGTVLWPVFVPITDPPAREPIRCRPDAAYLITGGMGALGVLMADWLAERGARRLVLAGREALPPRREWDAAQGDPDTRRKIAAIRALEKRGVGVDAVALDIGSREQLQALLDERDNAGAPPVRGVIHAAGLTESQLLTELDEHRLRRTLWPKVQGAQVLDQVFAPGTLDFLYLTASAGAVFGVPGQGAYAAGNAYLDCLARARHHRGDDTVSLDWVAWQGLGFASDAHIVVQELERIGSRPITSDEAFAAWEHVSRHRVAQAVMAPLRSAGSGGLDGEAALGPEWEWSVMSHEEVRSILERELQTILAGELGMGDADLELDRPFADMGLDSVMAMSVRRAAEQLIGVELSATMLWNHPTIAGLATYLTNKLLPQSDSTATVGSDFDVVPDADGSVLDALFDSVDPATAGSESGI
ncbi:type I polyketide synthase [Mycolicibacterium baixiangningiae]|uniref:type I polyketide synthase n=1 Tax=Mycolicibacterium baixiangningiae TaxID=2761578 RepID=UPI0018D08817|nr:type I polyketide synthase [Mycolicibacterium baixiangningiae]